MCGRHRRVIRTSPFTFVSKTVCSSSSFDSSNGYLPSASPALLTRMSRPPSRSTADATKRLQLSGSVTSGSSPTSVSSRSTRRAPPATRTPCSASARAVARPNPDEAPVTTAALPPSSYTPTWTMLTALARAKPHILRAPCDVVDLERRVTQPELLLQQMLQPAARAVTVGVRRDEDVGRERREAARHRPDVQVVHLDDVGIAGERLRHRLGLDTGGRGLEED